MQAERLNHKLTKLNRSTGTGDSTSSNVFQPVTITFHRVPFFLEPDYLTQPKDFTEPHTTRMLRKFGSDAAFKRVKAQQALIPRLEAVHMTAELGFTQENLDRRVQSSTLDSHRLVLFVSKEFGLDASERLYDVLNIKHFTKCGVLARHELLIEACGEIELSIDDVAKCAQFLSSNKYKAEILSMYERVVALGIDSIPTVVVDGRYIVASVDEVAETITEIMSTGGPEGKRLFSF